MQIGLWVFSIVLVLLLCLLSLVESAASQLSLLTLKVLAEKNAEPRYLLLSQIAADRRHFLLPIQFASQLILVALSALASLAAFEYNFSIVLALFTVVMIVIGFRHFVPSALTLGKADRVLLSVLPLFRWVYALLCWTAFPIRVVQSAWGSGKSDLGMNEQQEDEATEEEIQAYLGVGEEEGIFEREESELIQSALEFGNTLVREIMTPRNEIVAIDEGASLTQLKDLIVGSKHSRIPVYRERLDHVLGIVYVRNLLVHFESGREQEPITPIISEVLIVPETKGVSDLLREMQARAEQMAIVVNEYGTVSGLITIEDLLEEIVGEIRDEDEFRRIDVVYEGDGNYIIRGTLEVEELEETLGVHFGQHDAATMSGLVVEHLGSVPDPGQRLVIDDVQLQILSSDRKRIHTMRVEVSGGGRSQSSAGPSRVESG